MTLFDKPWGKTNSAGQRHALSAHSMDVAAVFERLIAQPVIATRLAQAAERGLSESDRARIAVLVFLHDVGKLHPGFQANARPDLPRWPSGPVSHSSAGAGLLTLAFKDRNHPLNDIVAELVTWGEGTADLLMPIFAHHGRPVQPSMDKKADWPVSTAYDWRTGASTMALILREAFPAAFLQANALPEPPAFIHLVAGLTALADWIGSDVRFFEFNPDPDSTYQAQSRAAAQRAVETIGVDVASLDVTSTNFAAVSGFSTPNTAQKTVGQTDPSNQLVILEAETGSGKTEAALWRFAQLFAAGQVSGMYFAVPTRAAARQLHERVNRSMQLLFGQHAPEAVLAIPGLRVAGDATGQILPGFETRWDDQCGPAASRWAAEHATRFLAATVAVGTIDQAMLSALQVKHAHLRGAALARNLLVIDEVHASDSYMTEVVSALLHGHLAIGGYAMLMSATLGSRARARYLGAAQPNYDNAVAAPYPAVWTKAQAASDMAGGPGRVKVVEMESRPSMAAQPLASEAMAAAKDGARVLVIRNTVTEAIATFQAVLQAGGSALLMQMNGGPALHHSRFASEDRKLLDAAAESALATAACRPLVGCIVIGSQTLEQSLDIDADILLTDLCPVDVLLQRIGRLHRHILPRPAGYAVPRAVVLCPEGGIDRLTKPMFDNGLGGWNDAGSLQGIYTDLAAIELTRRQISAHSVWQIPAMNRALVESATHPDVQAALIKEKGGDWEAYQRTLAGKTAAERIAGQLNVLQRDKAFPDRFKSDDEQVMTRLGAQGPSLTLPEGTIGPFGTLVRTIVLPSHWVHGPLSDDLLAPVQFDGGFEFAVGEKMFRYTRAGVDRLSVKSA